MGMAQEYLGGHGKAPPGEAGEGGSTGEANEGSSAAALLGAAQTFLGSGGGAVGGSTHTGEAGAMDSGLVDKLLGVFSATHGREFGGSEGDYDQLAGMAKSALGTPIGRDLLKTWVKQRLGI